MMSSKIYPSGRLRLPKTRLPKTRLPKTIFSLIMILAMIVPPLAPMPSYASEHSQEASPAMTEEEYMMQGEEMANQNGLRITLDEGAAQPDQLVERTVAETQPLSADETAAISALLSPLPAYEDDAQEFRLPDEALPPPRTGETIEAIFPPEEDVANDVDVADGPLAVLRFAPEGDLPIAPFLNVTFNQPMVPLAALQDLRQEDVPVTITPELPGVWKWLGTRTLSFEYRFDKNSAEDGGINIDRFPKATEYTVEIPAGTTSATGNELAEAVTWSFRTPPPVVETFAPDNRTPQALDAPIFLRFDQLIDADAVLANIRVSAGGENYALRLLTEEELAAEAEESSRVASLVEKSLDGRWIAFRSEQEFPTATTVTVDVLPGTPSAEGPLTTEEVQSFSFRTYAPLTIEEHHCGYGRQCQPIYDPFIIRFNNPLDDETFDESWVTVEPEIPGMIVNYGGTNLTIRGATSGRTQYTVTLNPAIQDVFGQTLGQVDPLTFQVGSARAMLTGSQQYLVTLDPSAASPAVSVYSINLASVRVRLYAVQPSDWAAYLKYRNDYYRSKTPPNPPGELILEDLIAMENSPDELVETAIDLQPALGNSNKGHVIVIVDNPLDLRRTEPIQTWAQITSVGLDAFVDQGEMVAWATELRDGSPLPNVELALIGEGGDTAASGTTATDGIATLELSRDETQVLLGEIGGETTLLVPSPYGYGSWRARETNDDLAWYVLDDRQMYRPGEEVHIKGWIRQLSQQKGGGIGLYDRSQIVRYRLMGPQGNDMAEGEASLNAAGGFDFMIALPEKANLGYARLMLTVADGSHDLNGREHWHQIQIQEFRRPEFEVTAGNETTGPYFYGDEAVVFAEAGYFAGGPLPNAETFWNVTASPTNYDPPNWPDYVFGEQLPWWFHFSDTSDPHRDESSFANFTSVTDASGKHYLKVAFDAPVDPDATPRPYSVMANGRVMDVNRQAWSAGTSVLVHPSQLYVGLRGEAYFVRKGEPIKIHAVVTDVDGNVRTGRKIEMRAARMVWQRKGSDYKEIEAAVQECTIISTAFAETRETACEFATEQGGRYEITATVTDRDGRKNQTKLSRWVSGGKRPPARNVEQEQITLIPSQDEYAPGDVAEILVQSPFAPAQGLLTVSRNGILRTERFEMSEETTILNIPIEDEHIPGLSIQVDVVGATDRVDDAGDPDPDLPPRPAYATAQMTLRIPPVSRTLALEIDPAQSALAPGESTSIDVTLTDANGDAVEGAELVAVVVDEAILALSNYQLTDPIELFYREYGSRLGSYYSRGTIVLANPLELAADAPQAGMAMASGGEAMMYTRSMAVPLGAAAPAPMAMAESMEMAADSAADADFAMADESLAQQKVGNQAAESIQMRTNFNPLALFAPDVQTDADGKATINVDLPDNLTRYRIMVVAAAGDNHFGSAESNLTARLPLMVRPSAPRFLRFGDSFEVPVVLQNQTDEVMEVSVVAQASNIQFSQNDEDADTQEVGLSVTVPANDRVEVRFPATTVSAGEARVQFAATTGTYSDAAVVDEIPVYTPATTEAFATYGVIDGSTNGPVAISQPLLAPEDVFTQFGGLEIDTSSTALQALTDALLYLVEYPYDCSEQRASRIMAVGALRDVLEAFEADGLPESNEMEAQITRDIAELQAMQNADGGFPYWVRLRQSIPYNSIYVAHALQVAKDKGFEVPAETQQRSLNYLRNVESYFPPYYSQKTRWTLSAYALYTRNLMGDVDPGKARTLFGEAGLEGLSLEGHAWLLHIFGPDPASANQANEIRRHLRNRIVETPGAANFTTSYGEDDYLMLHSNRRTDGVILDALISEQLNAGQPNDDLIPKIVNGLLGHRSRGRWSNTQENSFILLALDSYFNAFEAQTPDFVANVWLGEDYVGGHEFRGRSTDRHSIDVPMEYLAVSAREAAASGSDGTQDLILANDGSGRLYYRLGLKYAPTDLKMPPEEMGFVVQRTYEAVDDADDVMQDEDGMWRIKLGARVRVRVTMVADNRRYHVVLVDHLPAGFEIINPALAVSEELPTDPNDEAAASTWWWRRTWYNHQNLRDDRAEAFSTLLWDGVHNYSYVTRATTPGEFVAAPAKAEEMYAPEVFGRSASDWVIVE